MITVIKQEQVSVVEGVPLYGFAVILRPKMKPVPIVTSDAGIEMIIEALRERGLEVNYIPT